MRPMQMEAWSMNHNEAYGRFCTAYADLLHDLISDIKRIENPKHKVEKQQEFDKLDYYVHKGMIVMIELNNWLTVFGSPEEKQ